MFSIVGKLIINRFNACAKYYAIASLKNRRWTLMFYSGFYSGMTITEVQFLPTYMKTEKTREQRCDNYLQKQAANNTIDERLTSMVATQFSKMNKSKQRIEKV